MSAIDQEARLITNELRRSLLLQMLRIRMVEETIAERYSEQEMRCPVHLSIGQEAVAAGVAAALRKTDYVMSTHRAHAHYLAKGGDLTAMIAEIYGKVGGCSHGKGGSMHLIDLNAGMLGSTPIVGSSIPVAVGAAFGSWLQNEDRVTVVFFGEGATEEGVFAESINFATLKQLPIVFVCENNLYSVYSPMEVRQPDTRNRMALAEAHGMAAAEGDGNDVVEVYTRTRDAVQHARDGQGPVFLEFRTYRWREHCGPNFDNHIGYRTETEFLEWRKRCPIQTFEDKLRAEHAVTAAEIETAKESFRAEIARAFEVARRCDFPAPGDLSRGVYA